MFPSFCSSRSLRSSKLRLKVSSHLSTSYHSFQPGDLVLLRQKLDRGSPPILTKPLQSGKRIDNHKGVIQHDDVIGKLPRDVIRTAPLKSGKDGTEYRLHEVRLEEYVRLSRRLVTPVYPADAQVIVGLLDLHPDVYEAGRDEGSTQKEDRLEILEAGTGHGSLTLYLSRAIHAANPPRPRLSSEIDEEPKRAAIEKWKAKRKAIIHTIDSSAKYSAHARNTIAAFRRGQYLYNIDFHVTSVSAWTRRVLAEHEDTPFLSHAVLDLPGVETEMGIVSQALRTDGCLLVFCPSISQIMECVRTIKDQGLSLEMETVVELGVNGGSGGREWNVRMIKTKGARHTSSDVNGDVEGRDAEKNGEGEQSDSTLDVESLDGETSSSPLGDEATSTSATKANATDVWSMICRPKVGERIVGGGFVGVFRKQRDMRQVIDAISSE